MIQLLHRLQVRRNNRISSFKALQVLAKHFYTNASVLTIGDKVKFYYVLPHQVSLHCYCQVVVQLIHALQSL